MRNGDLRTHSETGTLFGFGGANVSRFRYAQEAETISSPYTQNRGFSTSRAHSKTGTLFSGGVCDVSWFRYAQETESNSSPLDRDQEILRLARIANPVQQLREGAAS
jgi:hypothetical protein